MVTKQKAYSQSLRGLCRLHRPSTVFLSSQKGADNKIQHNSEGGPGRGKSQTSPGLIFFRPSRKPTAGLNFSRVCCAVGLAVTQHDVIGHDARAFESLPKIGLHTPQQLHVDTDYLCQEKCRFPFSGNAVGSPCFFAIVLCLLLLVRDVREREQTSPREKGTAVETKCATTCGMTAKFLIQVNCTRPTSTTWSLRLPPAVRACCSSPSQQYPYPSLLGRATNAMPCRVAR